MKKLSFSLYISLIFLIISAVIVTVTAVTVNNISSKIPNKMLYLNADNTDISKIKDNENSDFEVEVVDNKDVNAEKTSILFGHKRGDVFFKNNAVEKLKLDYGIVIPTDDVIDLQPIKYMINELYKICLCVMYFIFAIFIFINATRRLGRAYEYYSQADTNVTTIRIIVGVLQIVVMLLIFKGITNNIDIPQQLISPNKFIDISYYKDNIHNFFTNQLYSQNIFLENAQLVSKVAVLGFGVSIVIFLIGCLFGNLWIRKSFLNNNRGDMK